MRFPLTDRMKELNKAIDPYFLGIYDDEVKWKEDTPDEIKEMYKELLCLGEDQRKLEIDLLF